MATSTLIHTLCDRCGQPVLTALDGQTLEADPDPLAVHTPDGGTVTPRQAWDVLAGRIPPLGHHRHRPGCNPRPLTLF